MRVGVIGVGEMGQHHLRLFSQMDVDLVGAADINEKRVKELACRYGAAAFTDYRELLAQGLDAVTIAVPTRLHREVALEAIKHGSNVLVEKPIADSLEAAEDIVNTARQAGLKLMVGHTERFNPVVRKLKETVAQGALGQLLLISTRRVGPFVPRVMDIGIIVDIATHDIDVTRYIIGKEPVEVFTRASKIRSKRGDSAIVVLDFGETSASIEVNWFTPHKVRTLVATGTKGIAYLDYMKQTLEVYSSTGKTTPRFEKAEPLRLELKHFLECISLDREPLTNGYEGLKVLKVALEAERQGQVGQEHVEASNEP